nr:hypothetical protein [Angustibacter aerolatus]
MALVASTTSLLHGPFADRAHEHPDVVAVLDGTRSCTYGEPRRGRRPARGTTAPGGCRAAGAGRGVPRPLRRDGGRRAGDAAGRQRVRPARPGVPAGPAGVHGRGLWRVAPGDPRGAARRAAAERRPHPALRRRVGRRARRPGSNRSARCRTTTSPTSSTPRARPAGPRA